MTRKYLFLFSLVAAIINGVFSQCSGSLTSPYTLTDAVGSFGLSSYSANADCSWRIQPPPGALYITITVTYLNTESCCDHVTIYDGSSTSATQIGRVSGSSYPSQFTTTQGSCAYVTFESDGSIQNTGFTINYATNNSPGGTCGLNIYSTVGGLINDGSATNDYSSDSSCTYYISPGSGGEGLYMGFSSFETEVNIDTVTISSGSDSFGPYSGSKSNPDSDPGVLESYSSSATVTFNTDSSVNYGGWDLAYVVKNSYCGDQLYLDSAGEVHVSGSEYYDSNTCYFMIAPKDSLSSIEIKLDDIDTEHNLDYVYIYDGSSPNGYLLAQLSGDCSDYENNCGTSYWTSQGKAAFIVFTTDGSITYDGFSFRYKATDSPGVSIIGAKINIVAIVVPICVILFIIFVVCIAVACARSGKRRTKAVVTLSKTTTTNVTPMAPMATPVVSNQPLIMPTPVYVQPSPYPMYGQAPPGYVTPPPYANQAPPPYSPVPPSYDTINNQPMAMPMATPMDGSVAPPMNQMPIATPVNPIPPQQ